MKPCRPCIYVYIKSFSGITKGVITRGDLARLQPVSDAARFAITCKISARAGSELARLQLGWNQRQINKNGSVNL